MECLINIELFDRLRKRLNTVCNRNLWVVEEVSINSMMDIENRFIWNCEYRGLEFEVYYNKITKGTGSINTFNVIMPWEVGFKTYSAQINQ